MIAMNNAAQPFVSIVTPVFNGEEYISQCIDSVLTQSHQNWDYIIIDNCSTDRTLSIAQQYAARDPRIRVHRNETFLSLLANHNAALQLISPQSKYCKMIFADDWLYPECIAEMVAVVESHSSVGIVGAYGLDGAEVLWSGLPYPSTVVSGREICRKTLLGGPYVFGTPSSLLMRSDLVRARNPFFNEENFHADNDACYALLQHVDFGFVHKILTYSRSRPGSNTSLANSLDSYVLGSLSEIVIHGPAFLTREECDLRREQWMKQYYRTLAKSFLRLRDMEFWAFHRERLARLGLKLSRPRLFRAVGRELLESLLRPADVLDGVLRWWPKAFSRPRSKPTLI